MPRHNLLIVDADPRNRRVLDVSLRKAGFSVTTAESAEVAHEYLEVSTPDLIIADTRLPGEDGFDFCTRVKANSRLLHIPFLFLTSEQSVDKKVRGLELGVDDYLTKPIYIKEITTRITMLLQRKQQQRLERRDSARTKFTGDIRDIAVVDLLQTIEISRKSGCLMFETEAGSATVWFKDGAIIDAEMPPTSGEASIYRLFTVESGGFQLEFRNTDRPQTIVASTQALLMEGMRRVDEWTRLLEQLPPLDRVLEPAGDDFEVEGFSAEDLALLDRFDGIRRIHEVVRASEDDLATLTTISRLYFEGALQPLQQDLASTSGFLKLEDWDANPPATGVPSPLTDVPTRPLDPIPSVIPPPPSYPAPFPQLQADEEPEEPDVDKPTPAFGSMLPLEDASVSPGPTDFIHVLQTSLRAIEDEDPAGPDPPDLEAAAFPPTLTLVNDDHTDPHLGRLLELHRAAQEEETADQRPPHLDEPLVNASPRRPVLRSVADEDDIPPVGDQVSPPPGAPRASASGVFDTSSQPEPDPAVLPTYVERVPDDAEQTLSDRPKFNADGLSGSLEDQLDAELERLDGMADAEAAAAEVEKAEVEAVDALDPQADTVETEREPFDDEEDLAEFSADEISIPRRAIPYGTIAMVIVAAGIAGFIVGTQTAPDSMAESNPTELLAEARQAYEVEALDLARAKVDRVLRADASNSDGLLLDAVLRIEEGDLNGAFASATRASELNPNLADAFLALAVINQDREARAAAVANYRDYLRLAPQGKYAAQVRRVLDQLEASRGTQARSYP